MKHFMMVVLITLSLSASLEAGGKKTKKSPAATSITGCVDQRNDGTI
jgi:hypothetical protein